VSALVVDAGEINAGRGPRADACSPPDCAPRASRPSPWASSRPCRQRTGGTREWVAS